MIAINPYINLTDQAEEALNFYKGVFGGDLDISRFGDLADATTRPVADEHKNLVMHGVLKTPTFQLMIADYAPMGAIKTGNSISISLSGDDDAVLSQYFEGLSQGGTVTAPLEAAPWGDKFGMLTDKFGVVWLVDIGAQQTS